GLYLLTPHRAGGGTDHRAARTITTRSTEARRDFTTEHTEHTEKEGKVQVRVTAVAHKPEAQAKGNSFPRLRFGLVLEPRTSPPSVTRSPSRVNHAGKINP